MKSVPRSGLLAIATAVAAAATGSAGPEAHAQDRRATIEEIVVVARKREENLQTVPIVVSAFTENTMKRLQIRELRDVAMYTPGFTFEGYANGASATPVIRGLAELNLNDLENNVSTFFDGIYLPRNYMTDPGLFGLERIEILKGPQSATYGRNAFAGAINYVTRKPGDTFEAEVEGTWGTHQLYKAMGALGGPIIPDRLAVRAGLSHSQWNGSWKNNHPLARANIVPGTKSNLGGHNTEGQFLTAVLTPTDALTVEASFYHFDVEKEFEAAYTLEEFAGGLNCAPQAGVNQLFCGRIPILTTLAADPRSYGLQSESHFYRGGITWRLTDDLTATYLLGHVRTTATAFGASNQFYTRPGTTITFLGTPNGNIRATSHELRLAYDPDTNVKGMLGLYNYKTTDVLDIRTAAVPALLATPITIANSTPASGRQTQLVKDWAGFGEISIDLLDEQLNLTMQGRYSEERKETRSSTTPAVFSKTFNTFSPRISLQYNVAEDSLVYASVAKGTKSGGFNATVFVESERAYGPDTNWTYEIGTKNQFLDQRLQVNGALYYTKWANLQLNAFPSNIPQGAVVAAIVLNSGAARAYGAELEVVAVLSDNLTVNAGGSIANPKFKKGQSVQGGITGLCNNVVCAANGDVGGNLLPRQSKEQFNAGFTWEQELGGELAGYLRGDVAWQSGQPLEPQNLATIGPRTVANASIGIVFRQYELQLWAKNLFNEVYISGSNVDTGRNNTRYTPTLGPRRTIGLTARAQF
jgi:iron complex outermembrane receptor protein